MCSSQNKYTPTGEVEIGYYSATSRHYDAAYVADSRLKDVSFYVDLAKSICGSVLEVGCGTGRILLPTAKSGVRIDGLDFTPELLDILRGKLKLEDQEIQDRVSLYEGDMRSFHLHKKYDLITVPFRPLQHLFTIEDQLAAFSCFSKHLKIGGKLAFNMFYPNFKLLDEVGVEKVELEWVDPEDASIKIRRSFIRKSVDKLAQFIEGEFIFRSYRGEQLINEERSTMNMSYYTYPQVLLLLKASGFKVKEEYGSYDKESISICKEMIFIAERG